MFPINIIWGITNEISAGNLQDWKQGIARWGDRWGRARFGAKQRGYNLVEAEGGNTMNSEEDERWYNLKILIGSHWLLNLCFSLCLTYSWIEISDAVPKTNMYSFREKLRFCMFWKGKQCEKHPWIIFLHLDTSYLAVSGKAGVVIQPLLIT